LPGGRWGDGQKDFGRSGFGAPPLGPDRKAATLVKNRIFPLPPKAGTRPRAFPNAFMRPPGRAAGAEGPAEAARGFQGIPTIAAPRFPAKGPPAGSSQEGPGGRGQPGPRGFFGRPAPGSGAAEKRETGNKPGAGGPAGGGGQSQGQIPGPGTGRVQSGAPGKQGPASTDPGRLFFPWGRFFRNLVHQFSAKAKPDGRFPSGLRNRFWVLQGGKVRKPPGLAWERNARFLFFPGAPQGPVVKGAGGTTKPKLFFPWARGLFLPRSFAPPRGNFPVTPVPHFSPGHGPKLSRKPTHVGAPWKGPARALQTRGG